MRGEPKIAESTFPALSAVLSVPILGDLLKPSFCVGLCRRDVKGYGKLKGE